MRWFTPSAEKRMRKVVRKDPVPSKTKTTQPKKLEHVQRKPQLRKPKVEMPFVAPACLHTHAVSDVDLSEDAMHALMAIADQSGAHVTKIKWVNPSPSTDDDNWCRTLAAHPGWGSFEAFWAMKASKPAQYRTKDERRGYSGFNGIMGVSHAGCDCYLMVTLSDGSVYHIMSNDQEPRLVSAPRRPARPAPAEEAEEGGEAEE